MLSRRNLMRSAGTLAISAAALGALAACAGGVATTASQLQQDASALINFATGALQTALNAVHITIPANLLGDFETALNGVASNAQELLSAVGDASMPILQRIMTGLKFVADVLTPFFPAAGVAFPIFQLLVSAAVTLVQGLIASFRPAAALLAPQSMFGPGKLVPMTMGQARQYLGG